MAKNRKVIRAKPVRRIPAGVFYTEARKVEKILQQAVRDALRVHKRLGNPVAGSIDGRVVLIPPEEIPVD